MGTDGNGYWSEREICGYSDCQYMFVLSDRGRGKSYRMKHRLIERAPQSKFMCLYRTGFDMAHAIESWTDPLVKDYPSTSFSWEGDEKSGYTLAYEGETVGWFRALTMVNNIKQEWFPEDLDTVWFDEFIPMAWKKLPGISSEGDAIRTIVKTIDHDSIRSREDRGLRPLKVFMFGNPFTWDNPILSYFKINPCMGYGVHRVGPGIVCEMMEPIPKKGGISIDDFLGDEVNKNQGWRDQLAFIEEPPKGSVPLFSFRMGNKFFTWYTGGNLGIYYVKSAEDHAKIMRRNPLTGKQYRHCMGTLEGLKEGEECIEGSKWVKLLKTRLIDGSMRFDNINTKFDWINAVTKL